MNIVMGRPQPTQEKVLKLDVENIGFGGARGGGKSWMVRFKAKGLAAYYPGIRILIVRRTYPELVENHIRVLRRETLGAAKYNERDKVLIFTNGSLIKFMYCAKDKDLDVLQGQEYDVMFLDEATQLSEYQMKAIKACLRSTGNYPKRVYYTMNPGGQGHAYIKRIFIDRKFLPFSILICLPRLFWQSICGFSGKAPTCQRLPVARRYKEISSPSERSPNRSLACANASALMLSPFAPLGMAE